MKKTDLVALEEKMLTLALAEWVSDDTRVKAAKLARDIHEELKGLDDDDDDAIIPTVSEEPSKTFLVPRQLTLQEIEMGIRSLVPGIQKGVLDALHATETVRNYGMNEVERDLVDEGKWIEAIKALRSRTYLSIRDAKDIIDAYRKR